MRREGKEETHPMIEMLVVGQPQALHEWFHLNDIHTLTCSHGLPHLVWIIVAYHSKSLSSLSF